MQGKWRESEPRHFFEAPHLKIKYDAGEDFAKGFIFYETVDGQRRKYTYEAYFRNEKWNIVFTTGDPENDRPFSDHDRSSGRFREIKGVPKFHRKDLAKDLSLKLSKFRNEILQAERAWAEIKSKAAFVQTGNSGNEYWLSDEHLIRVQTSPLRTVLVAIRLADRSMDAISRYIF